jgi:hypothetical protein
MPVRSRDERIEGEGKMNLLRAYIHTASEKEGCKSLIAF